MEPAQNQNKRGPFTQGSLDQFLFKKFKQNQNEPENGRKEEPVQINLPPTTHPIQNQFSSQNQFSQKKYYLFPTKRNNWPRIQQRLKTIAEGKSSLEDTILVIEYTLKEQTPLKIYDLATLKKFLLSFDLNARKHCTEKVFSCIAKLVLRTEELFPNPLPMLVQGTAEKVTLSKEQCACLLANMFMGTTIPQKNDKLAEYYNFYFWFKKDFKNEKTTIEKIKFIYHYFERISQGIPDAYIKFERAVLKDSVQGSCLLSDWKKSQAPLKNAQIFEVGRIEDSSNTIEIDFANQYLGGMALTSALAQEEIIFTVSPECIVGTLISEIMREDEAILIQGAERYCEYSGYRSDFLFKGPHVHAVQLNEEKVLNREILAIDALSFRSTQIPEYSSQGILRELNKAYVGFSASDDLGNKEKKDIATGRWGCGVFKGDVQLKFIIQWAAASRAGRDMQFYSFEDSKMKGADKIINKFKGMYVRDLVVETINICELFNRNPKPKKDLFSILLEKR